MLRLLKPLRPPLRARQASANTQEKQLHRNRQPHHLRAEQPLRQCSRTLRKIVLPSVHVWASALRSREPPLRPPIVTPPMPLFRRTRIPPISWTHRTKKPGLNNAMAKQRTSVLTQLARLPLPFPQRLLLHIQRRHRCSHLRRVPLERKTRRSTLLQQHAVLHLLLTTATMLSTQTHAEPVQPAYKKQGGVVRRLPSSG